MSAIDRMRNTGQSAREFWEEFYTDNTGGEHGPVGRQLVTEVEGIPPGTALDLGCGRRFRRDLARPARVAGHRRRRVRHCT